MARQRFGENGGVVRDPGAEELAALPPARGGVLAGKGASGSKGAQTDLRVGFVEQPFQRRGLLQQPGHFADFRNKVPRLHGNPLSGVLPVEGERLGVAARLQRLPAGRTEKACRGATAEKAARLPVASADSFPRRRRPDRHVQPDAMHPQLRKKRRQGILKAEGQFPFRLPVGGKPSAAAAVNAGNRRQWFRFPRHGNKDSRRHRPVQCAGVEACPLAIGPTASIVPRVALTLPKPEKFHQKMDQMADRLGLRDLSGEPGEKLGAFRRYLEQANEWINRYHRSGGSGTRVVHCRSIAIDVLIERLCQAAGQRLRREMGGPPLRVAVIALGGYGRSELCPFSDVDLMFLYPVKPKDPAFREKQRLFNDSLLYPLWDLRLKIGHSTRTSREALAEANEDVQSKNAMLEARFLCGNHDLFARFTRDYDRFIRRDNVRAYLSERLEDQEARRSKYGGTVFLQEPDIKNGVGGLRDYQNLLWMIRLLDDGRDLANLVGKKLLLPREAKELEEAYDYLLRVRNELHFQSKRPTDLLSIESQPSVAWSLGFRQHRIFPRVEAFMRTYYKAAYRIHHLAGYLEQRLFLNSRSAVRFHEVLASRRRGSAERLDGFLVENGRLIAESSSTFREDPLRMIRVFRHLQTRGLQPDFDLERLIEENRDLIDEGVVNAPEAATAFRAILQNKGEVYPVLSLMSSTGVLSRYLPEWERLHCLVQHEYYHRYTADQHILNTIRELDGVFTGMEADTTRKYRTALEETSLPALLYLILLLHDIGKSQGIAHHARTGVEIARPILERLHVPEKVRGKILFLIEQHLEMARIWQRFDLDDPETAASFARLVQDGETLRYLYVLTFCDARGTTRDLWNSYKDSLHTQLFKVTLQQIQTPGDTPPPRPMISQESILKKLEGFSPEEVEAHFNLLPERYFTYHREEEVILHLRMIHRLLETITEAESLGSLHPVVEWQDDLNLGLTVVNVVTWDRAGLFAKLAGAFALAGLSIVSSKALSRADHITIDSFYVSEPEGGPVKRKDALEIFRNHLADTLLHNKDLLPEIENLAEKNKQSRYLRTDSTLPAPIPPSVEVYHELSLKRTIIEIETNDELGLLYRLAHTISHHGFDITFARISTERKVAVDTFYIEPVEGSRDDNSGDLVNLRAELMEIVAASSAAVQK